MKPTSLDEQLNRVLMLSPLLAKMPMPVQPCDEPFLPFSKAIIDVTRDLVSGYVFDLAAYLALGAAGAIALERAIAYAGPDSLTVLHGAFVGARFAQAAAAFNADAVTMVSDNRDRDREHEAAYNAAGIGVFRLERAEHIAEDCLVQLDGSIRLRVVGAEVSYAGSGSDFAERVRAALQAWRQS